MATKKEAAATPDKPEKMKYGSAWYVAEPQVEIYLFINEDPSGLPENAFAIIERTEKVQELLDAVEPYFILGSGQST